MVVVVFKLGEGRAAGDCDWWMVSAELGGVGGCEQVMRDGDSGRLTI